MKKGTIKLTYKLLSEMLGLPDDMQIVNVFVNPQIECLKVTVYGTNDVLEEHLEAHEIRDIDPIFEDSKPQVLMPEKIYYIDQQTKTE